MSLLDQSRNNKHDPQEDTLRLLIYLVSQFSNSGIVTCLGHNIPQDVISIIVLHDYLRASFDRYVWVVPTGQTNTQRCAFLHGLPGQVHEELHQLPDLLVVALVHCVHDEDGWPRLRGRKHLHKHLLELIHLPYDMAPALSLSLVGRS
jgi:hypothetical protein